MAITEFESKILKIENLSENIKKITFSAPDNFSFKAGQYILIKCIKKEEVKWKPYSILNPPREKRKIELCIKIVENGFASEIFKTAKTGDKFNIKGPVGHFLFEEQFNGEHVMIATGTGITPLHSMIQEYISTQKKITLIFGVRKKENLIFHKEFVELQKNHKNFTYIPTLSREEWEGKTGRVQKHIPEKVEQKIFYVCGLKEQVLETEEILLKKGVPKEKIKKERYN